MYKDRQRQSINRERGTEREQERERGIYFKLDKAGLKKKNPEM